MHRDQAVIDQIKPVQSRQRTLAMVFDGVSNFLGGLVGMQMHQNIQLIGKDADALEVRIAHCIGGMWRKRGTD